jgi:ribosome-associated protein
MEDLPINAHLTIPGAELQAAFARSGGPGGQNVNKVNSKATLSWDVNATQVLLPTTLMRLKAIAGHRITDEGFLKITCQTHREQFRNLQACRDMLRSLILESMRPVVPRRPTKPSKGSQRRRIEEKKQTGDKKRGRGQRWE